jgi:hypothetical protein
MSKWVSRGLGLVVGVFGMAALATPAAANGVNTHTWISFQALDRLPDGELKKILSDPDLRQMIINGSIFPDGGYAVRDNFGEMAHWEPFVTAYIDWMRETYGDRFDRGEAKQHLAFLLGVASHGMGDETFDSEFMKSARIYDAAMWSEDLLDSFDTATDVMLVANTGVVYTDAGTWLPAEEIAGIYQERLGYTVSPDTLLSAQDAMQTIILAYGARNGMDPAMVARYSNQYPWAAAHLMDEHEPGSPPNEGEVVSAYWLSIWDRLHGASTVQNQIIATFPSAGSDGHITDHLRVESQVIVWFGHGVHSDGLAEKFRVSDSTGHVYPIDVHAWGGDGTLAVRLLPMEDWAANETFTVDVLPGISTLDGVTWNEPWSFQFSTRPATGPLDPTTDPTPHEGEPWLPPDDGGGCNAGGAGAGAAGWGAALAMLALTGRRRRVR